MEKIITATLLSAGLIMGSTSVAFATETNSVQTASVTLKTYNVQLATYNNAFVAYDNATLTFKARLGDFDVAKQTYKLAYESVIRSYKTTLTMRENLRMAISTAFGGAVHQANATFATAITSATKADQKLAATTARQNAITAATFVRKMVLDAVGDKPIKRVKKVNMNVDHGDDDLDDIKINKPARLVMPSKSKKD